jgi:hypothetical protein
MKFGNPRSQERLEIKVTGEKESRGEHLGCLFLE